MQETIVKQPRKIFEVFIRDRAYDVYDIEGKEHGGWNGEPKTWWVYYADKVPSGTTPPVDSDSWEPWSKSLLRRCWDIRFKEVNTSKEKWNETQFSHTLTCEMVCNGKPVYEFRTNDMAFALSKVGYLIVLLSEHSYNFFEPEKEKGRKIYFYGLPATVDPSKHHPGEIRIIPDYTAGINKQEWWAKYKDRLSHRLDDKEWEEIEAEHIAEDESSERINWGDALSDGHIDWHRDIK